MSLDPVRAALVGGALALAGAKLWAGVTGDLAATIAGAGDDPWGIVSLIMLYAGLAAMACLVLLIEPSRRIAAGVILAMPLVGNLAPALWLAWRGPDWLRSAARR